MLARARSGTTPERREFMMSAVLKPFELAFFDNDPPIVGTGLRERVCWVTQAVDATLGISVK
eukprot:3661871-Alexandrium_andersonii.AAC.1